MAKDRFFPDSKQTIEGAVIGLASPKDRLAAYVLDVTLLLPLVQLMQSPLKKWILESFLFEEGAGVGTLRMISLSIFIVLFVLYYTLMIWWKNQTLGKMFLNVRVISYTGTISLAQSFLRSVFLFFEFVSLGIPFLAIFSHPLRRPLHDRVADTLVISERNPVGFPQRGERWRAQWARGALSFVMGLSLLSFWLAESGDSPEQLSLAKECTRRVADVADDLEKIYEMSLLGQISDMCLYDKAREKLWEGQNSTLAHFVVAASMRDDFKKSNEYLNSLCEENPNHHLCSLSEWSLLEPRGQWDGMDGLLATMEEKNPYNFVRVFLASQLVSMKRYEEAQKILSPIKESGLLQPVVAALTFHTLLGQLKWEEAYWVSMVNGEVRDQQVLYFMQRELRRSTLSVKQQIQLLDFFYPSLGEKSSRAPASTKSIPREIRDIYRILEGRL